jgi:hypothetical protein
MRSSGVIGYFGVPKFGATQNLLLQEIPECDFAGVVLSYKEACRSSTLGELCSSNGFF